MADKKKVTNEKPEEKKPQGKCGCGCPSQVKK
jgi:hypothetical protein